MALVALRGGFLQEQRNGFPFFYQEESEDFYEDKSDDDALLPAKEVDRASTAPAYILQTGERAATPAPPSCASSTDLESADESGAEINEEAPSEEEDGDVHEGNTPLEDLCTVEPFPEVAYVVPGQAGFHGFHGQALQSAIVNDNALARQVWAANTLAGLPRRFEAASSSSGAAHFSNSGSPKGKGKKGKKGKEAAGQKAGGKIGSEGHAWNANAESLQPQAVPTGDTDGSQPMHDEAMPASRGRGRRRGRGKAAAAAASLGDEAQGNPVPPPAALGEGQEALPSEACVSEWTTVINEGCFGGSRPAPSQIGRWWHQMKPIIEEAIKDKNFLRWCTCKERKDLCSLAQAIFKCVAASPADGVGLAGPLHEEWKRGYREQILPPLIDYCFDILRNPYAWGDWAVRTAIEVFRGEAAFMNGLFRMVVEIYGGVVDFIKALRHRKFKRRQAGAKVARDLLVFGRGYAAWTTLVEQIKENFLVLCCTEDMVWLAKNFLEKCPEERHAIVEMYADDLPRLLADRYGSCVFKGLIDKECNDLVLLLDIGNTLLRAPAAALVDLAAGGSKDDLAAGACKGFGIHVIHPLVLGLAGESEKSERRGVPPAAWECFQRVKEILMADGVEDRLRQSHALDTGSTDKPATGKEMYAVLRRAELAVAVVPLCTDSKALPP
eukprot:TRINITY_DN834_c6_g1_i1.p1 TRINITY_DN834_c6_g1~~TRINITY_DN834_c6_g1_i1.p1  ORF type:complete len:667 (-),score=150.47 TRINITY_DN834_c6_g1_i1:274-2274(-)